MMYVYRKRMDGCSKMDFKSSRDHVLLCPLKSLRNAFIGSAPQHAGGMFVANTLQRKNGILVFMLSLWDKNQGTYRISLIILRCYPSPVLGSIHSGKCLNHLSETTEKAKETNPATLFVCVCQPFDPQMLWACVRLPGLEMNHSCTSALTSPWEQESNLSSLEWTRMQSQLVLTLFQVWLITF